MFNNVLVNYKNNPGDGFRGRCAWESVPKKDLSVILKKKKLSIKPNQRNLTDFDLGSSRSGRISAIAAVIKT